MPNWADILGEIQQFQGSHIAQANTAIDIVRRKYLNLLFDYTKRNVIAYYSGFLSKPEVLQANISDEDKNGFMMAIHKLDRSKGLDLILHTPGGDIAATQSIVNYLHKMFGHNIRAIIPQIAMSSGTMIACACREIIMSNHSNIGPIDPHLNGVPAFGVIQEFRRACKEIKSDPSRIPVWQSIIGQYRPTFLSQCENAIKWSNTFVQEQLENVMFEGEPDAQSKSKNIVKRLTDYSKNKTHNRHIHFEECSDIDLKVTRLESDDQLQDLLLTVHHCYMHALMNTPSYKMIENHLGVALVKREAVLQRQQ